MRLTLRTLLAYLDDTLDAEQARTIGQKVAESPVAQELIERIRRSTRRRRLANPPAAEGGLADPNTVAEYLDNELPPETLGEVEENCLHSEAHLAEIAACHQILTLVMTEPSRVPPTARQRMLELVKGPESVPGRKPAAPPAAATEAEVDYPDPDEQVLGLPAFSRDGGLVRQFAPIVGVALLGVALVAAVWMALAGNTPTPDSPRAVALAPTPATPTRPESTEPEASKPEPTKPEATKPETPEPTKPMPEPTKPATKPDSTKKEPLDPGPAGQPNPDRREIGTFTTRENVVLTRGRGATAWSRVLPDKRVFTADPIVALPGYRGRINLDSGLQLLLWGSVPELLDLPPAQALQVPIFESAVILHAPAEGLAADLTLLRGRVKLSRGTAAGDIRVRLRFGEERWDVTLRGENAEVLVDLINSYPPDAPFSADGTGEKPGTDVSLGVTGGQAVVKPGDRASVNLSAPPGQAALVWNSKEGTPETREVKTAPAGWNEKYPTTDQAKGVLQAAEEFSRSLSTSPSLEVALDKARKDKSPFANRLAVFAYGAIDSPVDLVDCLDDANYVVRLTAVPVLRHWQAQRPENDLKLVEVLNKQKGYTTRQADTMLRMLHGFADPNDAATIDLLTDALTSNKLGMRELAFEQMYQLDPKGFARARYSPVADQEFRDKAAADWKADWKKRQP